MKDDERRVLSWLEDKYNTGVEKVTRTAKDLAHTVSSLYKSAVKAISGAKITKTVHKMFMSFLKSVVPELRRFKVFAKELETHLRDELSKIGAELASAFENLFDIEKAQENYIKANDPYD